MPDPSTVPPVHGFCTYNWNDETESWDLATDNCQPGYTPEPPSGSPVNHGGQTQNVPGSCNADPDF